MTPSPTRRAASPLIGGAIAPIGWSDRRSGPVTRRTDAVVQRASGRHSTGPLS
jgi:hypothetical protein